MIFVRRWRWVAGVCGSTVLTPVLANGLTPTRKACSAHDDTDDTLGKRTNGNRKFAASGRQDCLQNRTELICKLTIEVQQSHTPLGSRIERMSIPEWRM